MGKAYGAEFMVKKTSGKLNGWFSYTYSRSLIKSKGDTDAETINRGDYYPSNYDKPHSVNFIGNYKFNRRCSTSLNMVYSTGRPITLPLAKYTIDGSERLLYSDRNQYRIPDYFRTDVSLNIEGNHKIRKLAHSFWSISVYNLTGRRNAYSVYFKSENLADPAHAGQLVAQPVRALGLVAVLAARSRRGVAVDLALRDQRIITRE